MRLIKYTTYRIFLTMKQIETFQMLADQTRLRALSLIQNEGELSVGELVEALDLSQPKVSRHLGALRNAGLLASQRKAQWVFYHINNALPDWQQQVVAWALIGLMEEAGLKRDTERLSAMQNRPAR